MNKRTFTRYTLDEYITKVLTPVKNVITFTEVHFHATWKPSIADFRKYPGDHYMHSMYSAHLARGFSDIAQHATIDPDGYVWDGRSLMQSPASATGFNDPSNDRRHPFMFELIGNFDKGYEKLEGAQLATAIGLCKALMKFANRKSDMVKFHREMTDQKTCPGSGIEKSWIIGLIDGEDKPMTPIEREEFDRVVKELAAVSKEVAVLKRKSASPKIPTWAKSAIDWLLQENLIDTPENGSEDFYRLAAIFYRYAKHQHK